MLIIDNDYIEYFNKSKTYKLFNERQSRYKFS